MPNKSPLPTGISTTNSNQQRASRAGGRARRWAAQGRDRIRSSPTAVALQLLEDPGDRFRNSSTEEYASHVYLIPSIPGDGSQEGTNSIQSIGDAATTGQEFNSLLKNIAVADVPLQGCIRVLPMFDYRLTWSPID